jgi:hypothetical protein
VDLAGGAFTANAAGIITAPATTNTGAHPGDLELRASDIISRDDSGQFLVTQSLVLEQRRSDCSIWV